jgi:RNA polymerase sigma factor (sigma-70 family)
MEASAVPREAAAGGLGLVAPRLLRAATDTRLVGLVRQGQAAAFEAIYDRYHRPIMSFCRHMLGDPEEGADAVQHTFTSAYTAIVGSDKPLLLRPWLFTIARNRCYSVLRARREHAAGDLVEPATEGLAAQVQRREDLRQLLVDLRELPDEQRGALVLAELGALSHNEIGTTLGVPPAKVKALVFQARESLIASRSARDTDCSEIRRELANGRGAALRRANLRRHLRQCQGCREYRSAVQRQRRSLAAILPVAPVVGLKELVLGATSGGTGAAGAAATGGGLLASSAFKGLVLKALVGAGVALVAAGGTVAVVRVLESGGPSSALADSGRLGAVAAQRAIRAGDAPFARARGGGHARDAARRASTGHELVPHRVLLATAAPNASVAAGHARRAAAGYPLGGHHPVTPAVPPSPHPSSTTPSSSGRGRGGSQSTGTGSQSTGTGSRTTGTGPRRTGTGSPGHGNAYGHQPGQDPGLHLGWGQGDGGGNGHPKGANPHG